MGCLCLQRQVAIAAATADRLVLLSTTVRLMAASKQGRKALRLLLYHLLWYQPAFSLHGGQALDPAAQVFRWCLAVHSQGRYKLRHRSMHGKLLRMHLLYGMYCLMWILNWCSTLPWLVLMM